jgi:hypothetical protein
MHSRPAHATTLLLVFAFALHVPIVAQPDDAFSLHSDIRIPAHFKTYSLFLVCNPKWLAPSSSRDLSSLYDQFQGFGRAIGKDNAAVWFLSRLQEPPHFGLLPVDDFRSVLFCQAWKLKPSEGPHIVIIDHYPDEDHLSSELTKNYAIYRLANMNPGEISSLLGRLTDQLVLAGKVDRPDLSAPAPIAPNQPVQAAKLWVRLLNVTQQTLNSFGCAWSFKISAGPVDANLKACKST